MVFFSFGWLPVYTQHDGLRVFNSCVNLDCSNIWLHPSTSALDLVFSYYSLLFLSIFMPRTCMTISQFDISCLSGTAIVFSF